MTEEENNYIKSSYETLQEKIARLSKENFEKDTEINKLNNVIDRMAEYIYSKTDFTTCGNIKFIKEYFMKERRGEYE